MLCIFSIFAGTASALGTLAASVTRSVFKWNYALKANNIMEIKLIVVRTADPKQLSDFYSLFGLEFEYHKHGNSPFHYSSLIGKTVLEIYPLTKSQTEADKNLRLGFSVDNFDMTIEKLRSNQIVFLTEPTDTDFGFMTIIEDPDRRKIELYKM